MKRTDVPTTWDERTTLLTFFDYTRDTVRAKCEALAVGGVGAAPLTTSPLMSIGGVVNHIRWVENSWIEGDFLGGPDIGPWTEAEPDREFSLGAATPIEQTLAEYDEQRARTDAIIAEHELDDLSARELNTGERPTLRWIICHLIEENARHNGHLDILRELADGVTGD
ncbi:MAG: DinB family protein [Nocardioidaceae bacterium]